MTSSGISAFGDADEFEFALGETGRSEFLVTGRGEFRACMTRMALPHIRLALVEEVLPRIAFVSPPRGMVRISFSSPPATSTPYDRARVGPGELVTQGSGPGVHERLDGP